MKKRIIALLLSLSVFLGTFALPRRASAAAPAIGAGIFALAWQIIGIMTGRYDEAVDAIRYDIENGWDGLTNPDSPFQQEWRAGCEIIGDTLQDWISCNKVTTNVDVIKLTHDQYRELYSQVVSVVAAPSVKIESDYRCTFLSLMPNEDIHLKDLPMDSEYFQTCGEAYAPIYYDDKRIIFGGYYFDVRDSFTYCYVIHPNYKLEDHRVITSSSGYLEQFDPLIKFTSLQSCEHSVFGFRRTVEAPYCFVYSNGILSMESSAEVNLSGMSPGVILTNSDYPGFLQSISEAVVSPSAIAGALSDLSNILPTAKNPTLSIPLDPDLDRPLEDQIQVEIDGEEDKPLSDYLVEDFEIPEKTNSELLKKFPFCIPYDFVRFLGALAADPIPPVFHIPISTRPQNLEQWADNETLGQYVAPDNPMFEINEEITLDFSHIPLVRPICNFVFIIGFVFLLLHVTTKFIQH